MTTTLNFAFDSSLVRVVMLDDEPWFVAKDVCEALGLVKHDTALERLDEDEKGSHTVETLGGPQRVSIVSEPGVYRLTFTSRKPEAEVFKRWIAHKVLPSLRRTGEFRVRDARPPVTPTANAADWPIAQINANVGMVREARSLFGAAAARQLWDSMGLPTCVRPRTIDENVEGDGFIALDRLLNAPLDGRLLRDFLAEAIEGNEAAARRIAPLGIVVSDYEEGIVIANSTSFLSQLFKGQLKHFLSLRHIAGARRVRARFNGEQRRGILLPLETIEVALHGVGASER